MPRSAYTSIDEGGDYVTVVPRSQREVELLNRQLRRIQSFMPDQKHRVTPTKLAKRLILEQAERDA
ncbi:conserved hypothetical protein [Vibrio crassostreae]|nr:conserved hypothetical protein [Vibrio crassostreae]CAK3294263.1 conserved hypothetical protein [Vibrio crassostreae]CAK3306944.1 conserved hypothetical protein [Vibrio crassostreae]CAK3330505.1 conserved hypothetical protein [Vibrio crassostreae]CAK3772392.1 conserved hypothetical protein [Vibrio crassostreae]